MAATGGTTNVGVIDDLAGIADVCARRGLWLHVDAAYGGAGLAAPSVRPKFAGIERCDSFIVDPHKWLFAPFDSCALLYRRPELAQAAHRQHAGYLDAARVGADWNPSDYAIHLTRRARGLPFWFSLAANGTRAYTDAVEGTLAVAAAARAEIERRSLPRARQRPRPDGALHPPRRLVGRRLPALERAADGGGRRRGHADRAARRDHDPHLRAQPAHHRRGHRRHPGLDGVTAAG